MSCNNPQEQAWALLQAARAVVDEFPAGNRYRESDPVSTVFDGSGSHSFHYMAHNNAVKSQAGQISDADLTLFSDGHWHYSEQLLPDARDTLDLYLPVLGTAAQPHVVTAHLGQSIDARIATTGGDAFFVTGDENRKHLHRLRSLCHAVVVGAGTVITDDPQLTTRAVSGASPVRIIIDPQARVPDGLKVLVDGEAPTWLLHADTVPMQTLPRSSMYRRLAVRSVDGQLQPADILDVLAANGLRRIFVEGGGLTVSRFFNARCLNRLQIAAAPLLVGDGVPALQIPAAASMRQALRPPFRLFRMGQDVMWDFQINDELWNTADQQAPGTTAEPHNLADLQRLL